MRGELFVEEDLLGIPNNTFIKRFFVSFPFCGLKWFSEEPKSTNIHCQLLMLENCGWVFGSGVNATNVFCEKSKVSDGIELFPFRLSLKSGDHVTEIRLATLNEELRQKWVADINLTTKMMHFVSSSYENDSMPYILMFDRLQASDGESIALLDVPLNNRLLCALSHFYTLTAPHGLMIHTLKLVGVTLQDTQVPLVNSVIHMAQYIETVSLAENQLTSKGVMLLCESLTPRQHLTALDLSENQICDQCMDMLTRTLGAGKEMQHLDFSRNQLTQQCVFFLVHRVATHRSRLVSVNFAHNPQLGDSITSFLSLLLYNKPSHLQSFNIAYCGITEMGVKELAMAVPFCSTLVHVSLEGAFCEPLTLTALLDTMSKVHRQRRAITSGSSDDLCVSVGGLRQACDRSDSLSFKSLKVAMPYISDCTALHSVLLRRRLQYANASNPLAGGDNRAVFDKFSSSLSRFDKLSLAQQEVAQSAICEAYPIVVLRLRLPGHLYSVEEVLETLATFMRVDASQFHLLSSSELCAESRVYSVIFTVAELSNARVFLSHERNYRAFQLSGDKSLLQMERTASVDDALTVLEAMASKSHPFLRKLGVKQVSIHYPTADGEVLSSDMVIVGASSGGRGFEDHYVPPFSAKDVSQYEGHAPPEDTDDDEDVDRAARLADHSAAEEVHGSEEDEEEEDYEAPMTRKVETVVQRANRVRTESEESAAAAADNITRDAYVAKLASRRQLRASNERLILAVRQLYKEGEMTSGVAKFWEGAFGHLKYKEMCKQGMLAAIDPGSNVFHAVRKRLQLCNAMFQRDLPAMKSLLDDFKASGVIEGGTTYIYAQRLYSELVGLQRRFTDVEHVAKAYEQLGVVEEYLLSCGTLGYAGEEMFLAVELRQTLVAQAVNEGNNSVLSDLAGIKHKALLSNLLISREVPSIENKLDELKYGTDDHLFFLAETIAAQSLLNEYATCMRQLDDAIRTRDLDALEVALSLAAYHYFYNPSVDEAITALNSLARNPSHLLAPIVQGLRENNMLMVERGFEGVHKMGWRHAALDSVICSKIFAKKSKIVQDDSIKSRLIKLCLAIKNGFPVKAGEMMQLLRRATAIGLETDSDMKPYLMILNKHMKKFTGLVKQERAIQQLIDADDIPALAKLLAGRGTGKLVMSAPSAYAQEEWLMHLEECCSGNFLARITDEEGKFDESEVFFTGTLEKAARNEQERVKGWRKRFFVLQAVTLTYLTKAHNGDKKGSIRVLGGGVRKMDPQETGGRPFCLELEEGRDISLVNPDLLDEARRQVRLHKIKEIERSVRRGIRTQQLDVLVKAMAFASDLEIMLDFELMNSAKACIAVLREKHLKRDLHSASRLVPESSRLLELVQLAESLNVDPNIPSYAKVIQLSIKSEVEQCLLRAVGALQENSPFLFRRAFRTIAKLDVGVFNTRQRYILAALILQHCGHLLLTMTTDGAPLSLVYKTLRHALSCCRQLMVETECMDAARLLISLAARASGGHHQAVASPKDGVSEKMSSIAMYLDGMRIFSRSDVQNDIHKFSRLRLNSAHAHKGLGISAVFSRKTNASMVDLMSFNSTGLVKSLLKYEAGVLDQPLCVEAFLVLHAIMGDRPLHSLARPRKGSVLRSKAVNVESVVLDLLDAGAVRYPVMRDELYFQLLKQLTNNPSSQSASRGWLLLSLYLHAFHPSLEALPFIKNFICDNVERLVAARHDLLRRSGGTDRSRRHHDADQDKELLAEINHFVNLASYCSKLVCNIEVTMSRSVDIRTASAAASSSSASIAHITADVVQQIFDQTPLTVELVLMTGSVYQFSIPYGQFSTAFSLMGYLYDRLVPPRDEHHHSHTELDSTGAGGALVHDENILSSDRYFASHVRTRDILALFRGFCLYSVEEANFNEDGSDVDLAKVPVQSELRNVVEWTDDLQWDLLLASNDAHSATDTDVNNSHSHSKFKFGRTVVLRRRNAMATEQFCDEYELFKDQVSARDVAALQALWSSWVQDQGAHSPLLPADHVRLDLVFAEDSRYVNSRLYPLSEDSFHYLLAMQLALCWVDDQASGWGEGDDGVIDNVTVGVRPCYKFFPRHSNADAHADSDSDADKSVAGRRDGQGSPHSKGGESDQTHDSESDEETERLHQHMLRKIEKLEQGADQDSSSDDEEVEDADEASVQSSEYVSSAEGSVGEALPGGKEKRHLPPVSGRYEDMSSEDRELLISLIDAVGVSLESVTVEKLVDYLRQFHAVATQEQVQLNASKYRYLLKRAYVQYLMSACPLYGNHFSEVTLVSAAQVQEDSEHRTTFVNDSALAALDECQVLVGVSASGLTVLDVTDWSVLFVTPVWDIQECIVSEVTRVNKKKGKGNKRQSEFADQEEVLQVAVNSLTITFRGERLREIVYMLDVWTRELLGRGGFPQGTEQTEDLQRLSKTAAQAASDASKNILQQYLQFFPNLPRPPLPEELLFSDRFIAAPKSRREMLARERAEEERVEMEMVRLATESQMERNQKQIRQGREEMKRYQSESEADGADEDSDNEGETDGSKNRGSVRRSKRQNRSVFRKSVGTVELREQISHQRLCAAVCGVSERNANNNVGAPTQQQQPNQIVIPAVPMRVGGLVKMSDGVDKKRSMYRPVVEESRGLDALFEAKPVGLSWNVSSAFTNNGGSNGANGAGTSTKQQQAPMKSKAPSQAAIRQSNEKLRLALTETQERRVGGYLQLSRTLEERRSQQTALVDQHTIRHNTSVTQDASADLGESADEGTGAVRAGGRSNKDPYLHGLGHYLGEQRTKKKQRALARRQQAMEAQEAEEQEEESEYEEGTVMTLPRSIRDTSE